MDDTKKTILIFSGGVVEAKKLQQDLEAASIFVIIKNHDAAASYTGFANISHDAIELSILETEIEKARPIVENFKEQFGL